MPKPLLRKGLGIFLFHFTTPSLPQLSFAKPYRPWIRRPLIPLSPSARTRGWKTRWKFAVQPCTIRADTLKEAGGRRGAIRKGLDEMEPAQIERIVRGTNILLVGTYGLAVRRRFGIMVVITDDAEHRERERLDPRCLRL